MATTEMNCLASGGDTFCGFQCVPRSDYTHLYAYDNNSFEDKGNNGTFELSGMTIVKSGNSISVTFKKAGTIKYMDLSGNITTSSVSANDTATYDASAQAANSLSVSVLYVS